MRVLSTLLMAPRRALLGLLVLAGAAVPAVSSAEIYGYVDSFGHFTYTNLPPPSDARVTDVIPDEPAVSPKALAEANAQAQLDAANERIRLLELEQMHQSLRDPDYPNPPVASSGCGPGGAYDCSDAGPAYGSGVVLYGRTHGYVRGYRGPYRVGVGPTRVARAATVHAAGGRVR